MIPRKFEAVFAIPGVGVWTETLVMTNFTDLQVWYLNARPPAMLLSLVCVTNEFLSEDEYEQWKLDMAEAKESTKTMFRAKD